MAMTSTAADSFTKQEAETSSGLNFETSVSQVSTHLTQNSQQSLASCGSSSFAILNSLLQMTGGTHPAVAHLQDLLDFKGKVTLPLEAALENLNGIDADLVAATQVASTEAHWLMDKAASVMLNWVFCARDINEGVLPQLHVAVQQGKGHAAANLLGAAQSSIAEMRKMSEDVRKLYVALLEKLSYLVQCTQVSLDFVYMSGEAPHGGTECDKTLGLQEAEAELQQAVGVLAECSYFWLSLHSHERSMIGMEGAAVKLRGLMIGGSKNANIMHACEVFSGSLATLCNQYHLVLQDGMAVAL